jgi:outer membrane protein assembly factor BamE (lipoprotein component of BamABCDE complex)
MEQNDPFAATSSVKKGMSKDEVHRLMGPPNAIEPNGKEERWWVIRGEKRKILRGFCVLYDEKGVVTESVHYLSRPEAAERPMGESMRKSQK